MNDAISLSIMLLSDATFASGENTAGEVDVEVEHSPDGLPVIGGKTIHGLLRDSWLSMHEHFSALDTAAVELFGPPGDLDDSAILHVSDAVLPQDVRAWARYAVERKQNPLTPTQLLRSITAIRRQTALRRTG